LAPYKVFLAKEACELKLGLCHLTEGLLREPVEANL